MFLAMEERLGKLGNRLDQEAALNRLHSDIIQEQELVIARLSKRIETQEATLRTYQQTLEKVVDSSEIKSQASQERNVRQQNHNVAFSTFLTAAPATFQATTLVFGGVILNDGNAYDRQTGIFTIPNDGVYLFTFSIHDFHDNTNWAEFVVDGQMTSSVYFTPPSEGTHMMGSNTAILRLRAGQKVWVQILGSKSGDSLQGTALLRSNTFSGMLLYA